MLSTARRKLVKVKIAYTRHTITSRLDCTAWHSYQFLTYYYLANTTEWLGTCVDVRRVTNVPRIYSVRNKPHFHTYMAAMSIVHHSLSRVPDTFQLLYRIFAHTLDVRSIVSESESFVVRIIIPYSLVELIQI